TLYYHFGSKEGLAQALLAVPMTRLAETLRGILDREGDPVATLAEMVAAHFAFMKEDPDRSRFLYTLFFGPLLGSSLVDQIAGQGEALKALMEEAVGRLANAGVIDPARALDFLATLRGMIVVHTVDYLYKDLFPKKKCEFKGGDLGTDLARRLVDDLLT